MFFFLANGYWVAIFYIQYPGSTCVAPLVHESKLFHPSPISTKQRQRQRQRQKISVSTFYILLFITTAMFSLPMPGPYMDFLEKMCHQDHNMIV